LYDATYAHNEKLLDKVQEANAKRDEAMTLKEQVWEQVEEMLDDMAILKEIADKYQEEDE